MLNLLKKFRYNPFEGVRYSKIVPDSRAMHTSFWQKLKDTFFVFKGGTLIQNGGAVFFQLDITPGLFDTLHFLLSPYGYSR